MAKSDVDAVTDETIHKGGLLVKLYFDMQSPEKEKLQPLMVDLVNERLMKQPGVVYCYGAIEEPMELDGNFSTSAVITVLVDGASTLVSIAFNYAPAGLEIIRPEKELLLKTNTLQSILLDISQISLSYSKYIFEKVMKKEDFERIKSELENRERIGKKLLDDKKGGEEKK